MKLPRLPRKCNVFDAKYSEQQMREYGIKCVEESRKNMGKLVQIPTPQRTSFIDNIRDALR